MTMRERIARAMTGSVAWSTMCADERLSWLATAGDVLAAMVEPTEAMILAADDVVTGVDDIPHPNSTWRAMIEAARREAIDTPQG